MLVGLTQSSAVKAGLRPSSDTSHNVVGPHLREEDYRGDIIGFDIDTANMIEQAILNLEVMPSMRALMTAGPALERDNTAGLQL
jgi:hypothetical protein